MKIRYFMILLLAAGVLAACMVRGNYLYAAGGEEREEANGKKGAKGKAEGKRGFPRLKTRRISRNVPHAISCISRASFLPVPGKR